ncbi:protein YeeZ isoform X3 [Salvia hispanica]|uniref:protein YeeZ isoform X3 n=1 Tax=Salvia hispanica TaxID=49212 RepID=UPI002009989A|nr:protein YeeZ isoform X3 [Salvia hispanica]
MEICCASRQLSPINLRFDQTFTFRPATVRCDLFPDAKAFPEISTADQVFILGMGFVGKFFAADLKKKGCERELQQHWEEETTRRFGIFSLCIRCKSPTILCHGGLLERALKGGRLRWLVYLSSTSVYGDSGGAWVDEDYPVKPESELARARLAAEEQWLCFGQNLGIAAHVFRLGGIYGPGRSAVDTILKQGPMSKGQKARLLKDYTSRVHVADVCQALHASILHPSPGKIYNIVDDDPAPREEVFEFARKLVEEKLPGRVYAERGDQVLVSEKPSKSTKRVSNARMKKELGVNLHYPSYRSGLGCIMENMAPMS